MKCWCKSDCCWVEVNLATLTCLRYYHILDIGVSLSLSLNDNNLASPDNIPQRSLSMVNMCYIRGCTILSLTAGLQSVSRSNGKMSTLSLYINRRLTKQSVATVVASPFSLWQAKCWPRSCLLFSCNTL